MIAINMRAKVERLKVAHGEDKVLTFRSCWSYSSLTVIREGRRLGLGGAMKPGGAVGFFRIVGEVGEVGEDKGRGLVSREDMVFKWSAM